MARQRAREAPKRGRAGGSTGLEKRLAAVDTSKIWYPRQPVAVTTAAASKLAQLAATERVAFWRLPGLDPTLIQELPAWARALTAAENAWQAKRTKRRDGTMPALLKAGRKLRSEILESARYLLRKDRVALVRLKEISRGRGQADLASDLGALAKLVRERKAIFAADEALPADAADRADELGQRILVGPVDGLDEEGTFQRRNRLYAVVLEGVRELRAAMTFRWRKQPEKLAMLGTSYVAQQKRASRARKKAAAKAAKDAKPA